MTNPIDNDTSKAQFIIAVGGIIIGVASANLLHSWEENKTTAVIIFIVFAIIGIALYNYGGNLLNKYSKQ